MTIEQAHCKCKNRIRYNQLLFFVSFKLKMCQPTRKSRHIFLTINVFWLLHNHFFFCFKLEVKMLWNHDTNTLMILSIIQMLIRAKQHVWINGPITSHKQWTVCWCGFNLTVWNYMPRDWQDWEVAQTCMCLATLLNVDSSLNTSVGLTDLCQYVMQLLSRCNFNHGSWTL